VCGAEAVETFADDNPFYEPKHAAMWMAFQAIDMPKISVLTVADFCRGVDVLAIRDVANECVSIANYKVHLKYVQKLHVQRKQIAIADEFIRTVSCPKADADAAMDSIRTALDGVMLESGSNFSDSTAMAHDTLQAALAGSMGGIYTHHWRLDRVIAPLPPGSVCTIGGFTGAGKSTLFNSIQRYMAEQSADKAVASAVFSMEMPVNQICWRIVAGMIGRSSKPEYLLNNAATDPAIEQGFQRFAAMPIYCKDTASMSTREIRREIKALHSSKGVKVFGIDHIGLVRQTNPKLSREQQIAEVMWMCKETAMEIDGWIFPIAQLNRSSQQSSNGPALHHLRDSGAIEADSDVVVLVHDPNSQDDNIRACRAQQPLDVNLIVAKNRHGGTGRLVVPFAKWCSLFSNEINAEETVG
jgi:replicative DNA helicase